MLYLKPIGIIQNNEKGAWIEVYSEYVPALKALEGFSHLNVLWWCDGFDNEEARSILETHSPYKGSPDEMGIFATRSPLRPNPIALSVVSIESIDWGRGIITIPYTDANDHTPLIDLKPYTPSLDRVEHPQVPHWCSHWPKSLEASGTFDWESQFNF